MPQVKVQDGKIMEVCHAVNNDLIDITEEEVVEAIEIMEMTANVAAAATTDLFPGFQDSELYSFLCSMLKSLWISMIDTKFEKYPEYLLGSTLTAYVIGYIAAQLDTIDPDEIMTEIYKHCMKRSKGA